MAKDYVKKLVRFFVKLGSFKFYITLQVLFYKETEELKTQNKTSCLKFEV